MTKDILEKALEKTREHEQKLMRRAAFARVIGNLLGTLAALAVDALVLWAVINFMLATKVSFLSVYGTLLLFQYILDKLRQLKTS